MQPCSHKNVSRDDVCKEAITLQDTSGYWVSPYLFAAGLYSLFRDSICLPVP